MKRITLRERGRIRRVPKGTVPAAGTLDLCWLEPQLFDRLMQFDHKRKDGAIFNWRIDHATARQWVGVIQIPGLLLELLPKIDDVTDNLEPTSLARDNLLVMLQEAGQVPLRVRDMASLSTQRGNLLEVLVILFGRRLRAELLKGNDRGYIGLQDDLRILRGKLLISKHVARNAARRERFTCAYEEFSPDTSLNRVLKAACRALLDQARSSEARESLSHCVMLLNDVKDVPDVRHLLDRVVITRQNRRFEEVFVFARLVLEQLAPTAASGPNTVFSLLFDMDRVFEDFIAAMVRRAIRSLDPGIRAFPQARTRRLNLMMGDHGGVLNLKPDLLIESPSGRLVIDTKWKRLGAKSKRKGAGISAPDLYQLYAYTRRYGLKTSIFLFPFTEFSIDRNFKPLDHNDSPEGSVIRLRFVKLQRNLRLKSEFEELVSELATLIRENLKVTEHEDQTVSGEAV